jgi:tetratricopeptide (TPR) repeat protein
VYERAGRKDWAAQELPKEPAPTKTGCESNDAACLFDAQRFVETLAASRSLQAQAAAYWDVKACRGIQAHATQKLTALPANAYSRELEARALADRALYPEAAKRWREALALDPENLDLLEGLAVSLRNGRDHRAALQIIERMLKKAPERPGVEYLYGDTLLELGRPSEARTALEAAVQRQSFQLEARASLGRTYLELDQPGKALPHLEAALPLDVDGTIHYQLAVACRGAGQVERAKQMFADYARIREAAQQRQRELDEEVAISAP